MGCTGPQLPGLTVRIVDDPAMQALKQQHLGVDEPTDVLSFPAGEPIPGEPPGALGELVLNRDAIGRQAGFGGHRWLDEATQHNAALVEQTAAAAASLSQQARNSRWHPLPDAN